ncbi:geranylgeranyl reductase family protein [Streptosporangium sp. NBC_01639]|uniref:geranylgeranyl reductase family protein n=1 Tax=unclassified Streptosporangium TaxID=2632669 RepID=UPI002DDACF16|nr:geranylgeranyl reductase family protein [Streptosporangium sp. NBC_01756]WSC83056.1 geranylgeranyl reductase family protein [Streptosporangium sp. NBC_01756]WTD58398.1 geranylgeranyl reductase family protein [Streptosporangium sp. NBC_01639]
MTVPAAIQRNVAEADADVIVVGAGPAGSTTAFHLAQAGLDVLLLEKTTFPREKVCGDGLTPRAVKQLIAMGIDIDAPGWVRNKGLRVVGGGMRFELDWPELSNYPDFGLVRTRQDFDEILADNAVRGGVRLLQGVNVTAPILDDRSGHIVGVVAKKDGEEVSYRSRLVVAADGNSTRISLAMGLHKREDRPMGVAVRTYFESPRHDDDYLETWLELWDGDTLLPGYGWIFGVGDGTSNVGLGLLNTSESFKGMDYRDLLKRWVKGMPPEWGYVEENMTGPIRGAALPMAFNRQPHYTRGLVLVGDAGGMINPFNGEGIAYAMETGHIAAESIVQALARTTPAQRERVLRAYPQTLKDAYGGYFTLGRGFVELIGHRGVMDFFTRHALPHPGLMRFALKLLANLTDRRGDASDRIINALSKVAPPA